MVGIIYKMTIIEGCKRDGKNPFYIGQHWCESKEDFLRKNYPYWGCGSVWVKHLNFIKKKFPQNWKEFLKREVLCCIAVNNQKVLDKLEELSIDVLDLEIERKSLYDLFEENGYENIDIAYHKN